MAVPDVHGGRVTSTIELPESTTEDVSINAECLVLAEYLQGLAEMLKASGAKDPEGDTAANEEFANRVVSDCVRAYTTAFSGGQVGLGGTGKTGRTAPLKDGDDIPTGNTGLIYGRVQSGKTNATIATLALAACNGFRVFVVLTSDNTLLGGQTVDRLRDMLHVGPRIIPWTDFGSDPETCAKGLRQNKRFERAGVVFVSTKNVNHLASLDAVLRKSGAHEYPAIIIDDEADNASLDTKARKADEVGAVFDSIASLRRACPQSVYLQVTATPQSLLLQAIESPCRPVFCEILTPGEGYTGGEAFFDKSTHVWEEVPADEHAALLELLPQKIVRQPPDTKCLPISLKEAIGDFLVGCAYLAKNAPAYNHPKCCFLAHVSTTQSHHRHLHDYMKQFVTETADALSGHSSATAQAYARKLLERAHGRLSKTCHDLQTVDESIAHLQRVLENAAGHVVNADAGKGAITYQKGPNFLVGGNRLGRGLTIPNLLVTYYGRNPKTKMADTVHQHARMFGYRAMGLPVSRLYTPKVLFDAFEVIHKSDELSRRAVGTNPNKIEAVPLWIGSGIKPTRANVYDPTLIAAMPLRGTSIYPPDVKWKATEIQARTKRLDAELKRFDDKFHEVDIQLLVELLADMPSRPMSPWKWEDERVRNILLGMKEQLGVSRAHLWVKRGLDQTRHGPPNTAGFLSGTWGKAGQKAARESKQPVLMLTRLGGSRTKGWDDCPLYTPTLIFPDLNYVLMYIEQG